LETIELAELGLQVGQEKITDAKKSGNHRFRRSLVGRITRIMLPWPAHSTPIQSRVSTKNAGANKEKINLRNQREFEAWIETISEFEKWSEFILDM
jgi:hypothetical protein